MNCPTCNCEMEEGYVQAAREVFFSSHMHTILFSAYGDDDILLSRKNFSAPYVRASICKKCKKVVIDYSENDI